jgi:hypothetical protein
VQSKPIIAYVHGTLRLLEPLAGGIVTIMTLEGRAIATYKFPSSTMAGIPVGRMESGVYFVKIISGNRHFWQKLQVTNCP